MNKFITLTLAVLCLALQPMSAQKSEGSDNFKYHKACEIIDDGGDLKEARKLAYENMQENPKHIDSYMLLVKIDRYNEDYASAMKTINDAMKNNHKNSGLTDATLLWWKAFIYDDLGQTEKALETMEQVVKMGRKQNKEQLIDMLQSLAQFRFDMQDYDGSDEVYQEMLKIDESALLPRIGLARNLNCREKYDEALALLDECLKYDKEYDEVYRFRMEAFEGKKEYKKMIDVMVKLYEVSENSDHISINRFKKDLKYSVAVIKQKIASDQNNAEWKIMLASLYEECYRFSDVLPILNGLIDEYGVDPDLLECRVDCYNEMGMTDLALKDLEKILEICNEKDRAYYHRRKNEVLRYAGRYAEAIEEINHYIDRYPAVGYGYYARGLCKELSGDLEGAMKDYEDGIAVDEDYPYLYLMRGEGYLLAGKNEFATADFERIVAIDTVVGNNSCRHYALHFLGSGEEGLEWMNKMIAEDPDNPGNWYDKACLLSRMGNAEESLKALRTAFEKGYRSFPHIEHDDDLDLVRERDDFKALIQEYKKKLEDEIECIGITVLSEEEMQVSEVDMKKMYGGTYEVACSVNGLPLKMIFDTGASDVTISSVEASFMLKNGYLTDNDVKGKTRYMTASGDIHEGTVLKLKEVKLGDAVLKNIEASVVHSQKAPLLLGQSVLEKFGTITIDNVNSKLLIKQ
ncbi:MAG: TIGR02281 family clan AA aspartic protease [Bacteroidales bacterium]|nr:TIGR02281 family clan AA aspartic protease [Bacteroidales bacterium]MBQ8811976.1 TIGR02281 family clan AA aspartic protease [Bacteroidales bacterium]